MDMNVAEPIRVASPDELEWADSADVVVVGYGGAGAAAALQAREEGADVLALDRFGGGGATGFSGGVIYASGTPYQREAGIEDNAEEMYKYLKAEQIPLQDETLRRFCNGSAADIDWLAGHGVPYGGNAFLDKTAFPPDGYWLYYSGNENTDRFRSAARPAPRGHRVKTPGNGGWLHHQALREAGEQRGVRVMKHAPVRRLVLDPSGNVLGVEVAALPQDKQAEHQRLYEIVDAWKPFNNTKAEKAVKAARELEEAHGQPRLIRARNGVILASGGFINNLEMLAQYQPEVAASYKGLLRLGSLGCDGSGIRLGESAGGKTDLMTNLFIGSPLSPPLAYVKGGILVNTNGERFTAEDAYHAEIGNDVIRQPGCKTWLILEADYFWKAMKEAANPGKGMFMTWGLPPLVNALLGGTKRARSLAKLAKKIGVDPDGLTRTVEEFNAISDKGGPDPHGKSPDKLHALRKGPFYAVNFAIDNFWYPSMAFTLGGLVVDEASGEVQRDDGSPIGGLYAAGRTAVGICSRSYMSGLSIADTVFSGRRAGRHAASGGARQAAG
jgi:3-oxo-5alpha-steroid 4-dehydrogenase